MPSVLILYSRRYLNRPQQGSLSYTCTDARKLGKKCQRCLKSYFFHIFCVLLSCHDNMLEVFLCDYFFFFIICITAGPAISAFHLKMLHGPQLNHGIYNEGFSFLVRGDGGQKSKEKAEKGVSQPLPTPRPGLLPWTHLPFWSS